MQLSYISSHCILPIVVVLQELFWKCECIFKKKIKKQYYISMEKHLTTEQVLELLLDEENDDVDEHFDLGSDDDLEFDDYYE